MIPVQNKNAPRVLAYIEANPESSAPEIATALAMAKRTVDMNVNRLVAWKLIHISDYMRPVNKPGKAARLFTAGPGVNAKRPGSNYLRTRKNKAAWARKRRAKDAVLRNASKYGVFGVVAAQIERHS